LKYVYPVVSRRAGGVSIGVNLNPNNACNWRCVYCQVPDLSRGSAPPVDFALLEQELRQMLDAVCRGTYLQDHAPPEARLLKDIAISGNGEPTSCPEFARVIDCIGTLRDEYGIASSTGFVLISNGSLVAKPEVQLGLEQLARRGGEVWFKLDRGSDAALRTTNGATTSVVRHQDRLRTAARLCRTFVQSCWYTQAGYDPPASDVEDFISVLERVLEAGTALAGVQLYTLARKPQLAEGKDLGAVSEEWLSGLAGRLRRLGLEVRVSG
jgi:hypothetical protein